MTSDEAPLGLSRLSRDVARQVSSGEHFVLWGPRGSGKTTLLRSIERRFRGRPLGHSTVTSSLDDVTTALGLAFPTTQTHGMPRRLARARLWRAADAEPAVLLLDHAGPVGTAMKGWLRRLRGGVAGIVLVFDVDSAREREALKPARVGSTSLRMPPMTPRTLARLLRREWLQSGLPTLGPALQRQLVRTARGRPGWVVVCSRLAATPRYWRAGELRMAALQFDTEAALRGTPISAEGGLSL